MLRGLTIKYNIKGSSIIRGRNLKGYKARGVFQRLKSKKKKKKKGVGEKSRKSKTKKMLITSSYIQISKKKFARKLTKRAFLYDKFGMTKQKW